MLRVERARAAVAAAALGARAAVVAAPGAAQVDRQAVGQGQVVRQGRAAAAGQLDRPEPEVRRDPLY